ncbi:MAG: hypothetical protein ACFFEJ_05835 [Candidatus Thorarchaeota archaeon]
MAEMKRNAKGSDAVELSTGASVISITPANRPKIRKLSIISEVKIL